MEIDYNKATTDAERLAMLEQQIAAQERIVFRLRHGLATQEGVLEGLYKLRETLGAPALSHKHTLRGRVLKYLAEHPDTACADLAKALGTPLTTMNMCLHRNKNLFEQTETGWRTLPLREKP